MNLCVDRGLVQSTRFQKNKPVLVVNVLQNRVEFVYLDNHGPMELFESVRCLEMGDHGRFELIHQVRVPASSS